MAIERYIAVLLWLTNVLMQSASLYSSDDIAEQLKMPILLHDAATLLIQFVLSWPTWISVRKCAYCLTV